MFELLYQILHQNWRYFFKNSVLTSVQRGASEDAMENEAQFTAAMQVCVFLCLHLSSYNKKCQTFPSREKLFSYTVDVKL